MVDFSEAMIYKMIIPDSLVSKPFFGLLAKWKPLYIYP